jgi:hypothetical protein
VDRGQQHSRSQLRPGVLVLAPENGGRQWDVVEVDSEIFSGLSVDGAAAGGPAGFSSAGQALGAAFDVLTLLAEGRLPAMHEYVQESVRDFVRALEERGYDREAAVKILLDMADRRASDPPKAPRRRPVR